MLLTFVLWRGYRPRTLIYAGGESGPARDLAAELADVWFINGQPLAQIRALIADVRARPRDGTTWVPEHPRRDDAGPGARNSSRLARSLT